MTFPYSNSFSVSLHCHCVTVADRGALSYFLRGSVSVPYERVAELETNSEEKNCLENYLENYLEM